MKEIQIFEVNLMNNINPHIKTPGNSFRVNTYKDSHNLFSFIKIKHKGKFV